MSYQVLARKWRPQNFQQLVGQEHVVAALVNALTHNRLHHAYLFTGTRGVGKTTLARILSKSLNCDTGITATPCGQCATCQEIEQGKYVDLLEIDAASRTKVEDTRELLDNVQYKPTRGRFKVYLIDEVHMLSKHSFNALLKTLEEPPPHVKFLLATTDPQKLPITVLSRCLQFSLKAMTKEQVAGQLTHILQTENIHFEPTAIGLLAKAARGSMRDALSLTDQAIAQSNGQVNKQQVAQMLGTIDKSLVLKLLLSILKGDASQVFQQLEEISLLSPDYQQLLSEFQSFVHQIALAQYVPQAAQIEQENSQAVLQLASKVPAEMLQLFYQILVSGKKELSYAADGKSGMEMIVLRLLAFKPDGISLEFNDIEVKPATTDDIEQAVHTGDQSSVTHQPQASSSPDIDTPADARGSMIEPEQTKPEVVEEQSLSANDVPPQVVTQVERQQQAPIDDLTQQQAALEEQAALMRQQPPQTIATQVIEPESMTAPLEVGAIDPADQELEEPAFNPHDPEYQRMQDNMFADSPEPVVDYQAEPLVEQAAAMVEPESVSDNSVTQQAPASNDTQSVLNSLNMLRSQKKRLEEDTGKKSGNGSDNSISDRIASLASVTGARLDTGNNEQNNLQATAEQSSTQDVEPAAQAFAGQTPEMGSEHNLAEHSLVEQDLAKPGNELQVEALAEGVQTAQLDTEISSVPYDDMPYVESQQQSEQAYSIDDDLPFVPDAPKSPAGQTTVANEQQGFTETLPVVTDFNLLPDDMPEDVYIAAQLNDWAKLADDMQLRGLVRQLAINAEYNKCNSQVKLSLAAEHQHLNNPVNIRSLTASFEQVFAEPIELLIEVEDVRGTPRMIQHQINGLRLQRAKQSIATDPWVQRLMTECGAQVVNESIKALP